MDNELTTTAPPRKAAKIIGNIISFLILLVIASGAFYKFYINPCNVPIKYAIGEVDSRFKLTNTEIEETAKDAASRWNLAIGKNVYQYDPNARLKINFVYDERQQKLDETKAKIAALDGTTTSIEDFKTKLQNLANAYETDLNSYNAEVEKWNQQGGAPADIYARLNSDKASLDKRRTEINKMAEAVNTQIDAQNSNVNQFNQQMDADKGKIVTNGEYFSTGDKINIYTYGDKNELRLVLMHELGHALSTDHIDDPKSIMNPVLGEQNMTDLKPTTNDISLVDSKCRLK